MRIVISLQNLLDQSGNIDGLFTDVNNTGALINGDTLDLNLSSETSFTIEYTVDNICGVDTALIIVDVVDETDAGTDQTNSICEGSTIDLNNYVAGDPGGSFYTAGESTPITEELETVDMLGETIEVLYIVGDGTNCPSDTSIYEFPIIDQPSFDAPLEIEACDFYRLPTIEGEGLDGDEQYYTMNLGMGISFNPGDTIFSDDHLYLFYSSGNCSAIDSFAIDIKENTFELVDNQLCPTEQMVINGTIYDFDSPTGEENLMNSDGCDSTITIMLSFYTIDTNLISSNLCFGESISVNGNIYDESMPQGTEVLAGMASSGCDSIVRIDLSFSGASITPIQEMICPGDSILINNIYYSEDNPTGQDTISLQGGCDSILDISLLFFAINTGNIDTTICEGESIMINGTLYDVDNSSGLETLAGMSSTGCDSLVDISISFYSNTPSILTGEFCPTEIIDTLGVTLDIDSPNAEVILAGQAANGCDSIVNIAFTFIDVEEGLITETICEGGSIMIEGTEYNENNPMGSFTVQNAEGCDSLVNVFVSFSPVEAEIEVVNADCTEGGTGYVVVQSLNVASMDQFYILDNSQEQVAIEFGDTIFNISPGNHNLELLTGIGCSTDLDFMIEDAMIPTTDLPELITINEGGEYALISTIDPTNSITWTPDIDISCTDCATPIFSPSVNMDYYLELTNSAGCTVFDTISIRVLEIDNSYIPNTFTPNDDGVNDRFNLFSEKDGVYDLFIYDRWGNKVFEGLELETNNTNEGWSGNFNGKKISQGVYAYYIVLTTPADNIEDDDIVENFIGSITVIR